MSDAPDAMIPRLQAELAESRAIITQLRHDLATAHAVLERAPDAIIIVNEQGIITMVNAQADAMFGYDRNALIGQPIECLVPEAVRKRHRIHRKGYHDSPHARPMGAGLNLLALRCDGSEFPAEISLSPMDIEQGLLVIAIIRDVSERTAMNRRLSAEIAEHQRLEAALRESMVIADRANQAKSEFLSRMSHELRTPLNAILGFAQVLQMDSLSHDQHTSLNHILSGGRHLLNLINEILDLSRVEAGHIALSMEPVQVLAVVLEAVATIRLLAETRGITIHLDLDLINAITIMADRQRLKQVLLNVLSNAVKYNRDYGTISISGIPTAHAVTIHIADTGIGIPAGRLADIFIPFERLGAEQTTIEGTGLGLALSKRLVELMGGTITGTSTIGQGSVFTVEFPQTALDEIPVDAPMPFAPWQSLSHDTVSILLIEDNLANLKLIERLLNPSSGVTLLAAIRGRVGIKLAREYRPALILLDLHLPDMPGEEVLQHLLAEPETQAIPVVIVTADATPRQAERLLASGARAYLTKPIDVPRFLQTIRSILKP